MYVSQFCLCISVFDLDGRLVTTWGNQSTVREEAVFLAPHTVAVDSHGDVYVGEVSRTYAGTIAVQTPFTSSGEFDSLCVCPHHSRRAEACGAYQMPGIRALRSTG